MNVVLFPLTGSDKRMAILGELLRQVSRLDELTPFWDVWDRVRAALDLTEESSGHELLAAGTLAIQSGLIVCSTYDPVSGEMSWGGNSLLGPCHNLKLYAADRLIHYVSDDGDAA